MASGINELLDQLYNLITDAWGMPLSTEKCILDRNQALSLLDEIKTQLPGEVIEAKRLINGKAELIRRTKEEVDTIRREASSEVERLVSRESVVRMAKRQAESIVRDAEKRAAELQAASNSYADDVLRRTCDALSKSLSEIQTSRASFRSAAGIRREISETEEEE